ncbi:hypothetical protein [Moraxella lacunata]|uniref:hypothetical protein n=1 Tax=Moraxella lacunata TaxID=477 RepID=UPI003EDFA8F1
MAVSPTLTIWLGAICPPPLNDCTPKNAMGMSVMTSTALPTQLCIKLRICSIIHHFFKIIKTLYDTTFWQNSPPLLRPFDHIKPFYGETSDPIISITSDSTAVLKKKDNTL